MAQQNKREKIEKVFDLNKGKLLSSSDIIKQVNDLPNKAYKICNNMELAAFLRHLGNKIKREKIRIANVNSIWYKML